VGNFPVRWAEWNGRYRDTIRDYWRGQTAGVSDLAYRLTGSSDLYQEDGRRPWASVNFVTAHDGFTLRDLVSYNEKHNQGNGEDNRDGTDDNRSWNHGVEGPTDDPEINALRARQQRNFLATLFISQGCPMVLSGDEIGRTQQGNNNAYCQDNEISWLDWEHADEPLRAFTQRLIELRRAHPVLHRQRFFTGQLGRGHRRKDIAWYRRDGREMTDRHWTSGDRQSLGMLLNGDMIPDRGPRGERIVDDTLLVLLHSHHEGTVWQLPTGWGARWEVLVDTARPDEAAGTRTVGAGEPLEMVARSLVILRSHG
jgi:glycogen operon protein